jgi:hypothetical protein
VYKLVIKHLIVDIERVQEDFEGHCLILVNKIEEFPRKLLDDNHTFLPTSEIVQVFKEAI